MNDKLVLHSMARRPCEVDVQKSFQPSRSSQLSLRWIACSLLSLVSLVLSVPVRAQSATVFLEQGQLVRASRNVAAVGADLAGDRVNLYTGTLEFVQTDVSLPGNSVLPVSLGRRYVASNYRLAAHYEGHFVDWDLEIPRLHGIYVGTGLNGLNGGAANGGWVVPGASAAERLQRCSRFGPPPPRPLTRDEIQPSQYWSGHMLYVPGAGDRQLLARDPADTLVPGDGYSYPVVTTDHWQLRCVSGMASPTNGPGTEQSGEGFIALAPDGTQYRFDWIVTRSAQGLSTGAGNTTRVEVWIMPTVVKDRFGNTVTYTYDSTNPWRLLNIQSSDGRQLTLSYGTGNRVASVTDGTRTWYYDYSPISGGSDYRLTRTTLPDNSAYTYDLNEQSGAPQYSSPAGCNGTSTWSHGTLLPVSKTSSITHPSGAVASFTMAWVAHGRAMNTGFADPGCPTVQAGDSQTPVFAVRSLVAKTLSGPGLPASIWTYDWGAPNGTWNCAGTCLGTKTLTLTDPRNVVTRYTYGIKEMLTEGQLQLIQEAWDGTQALKTTEQFYRAAGAGPYPTYGGSQGWAGGDGIMEITRLPLYKRVIRQQGKSFTWEATAFDTLARVTQSSKYSTLAYSPNSKSETTEYFDHYGKWVLGQVARTTTNGIETGKTLYDSNSALPQSRSQFGKVQVQNYGFHPDGMLASVTDGAGHTTSYSDYKRGLSRRIDYADGRYEIAEVNDLGLVTRLTNAAQTSTDYGYDTAGRLASITPPSGDEAPPNTTMLAFEQVGNAEYGLPAGHWRQTVSTGAAVTTNYFDALWRLRVSHTADVGNPSVSPRVTLRHYDIANRPTFQSYPRASLGSIDDAVDGTTTAYDGLGRIFEIRQASELGVLVTTTEYLDGFLRRTTDARLNASTASFQAFDTPSEEVLASVSGPQGLQLSFSRDVFGKTLSLTKSGTDTDSRIAASVTRSYVYDSYQLLCKTLEPELGATFHEWDAAGNLAWRTGGTTLTSSSCDRASAPTASKLMFGYDERNRLKTVTYGDGSPGIVHTYTADGLPETNSSDGAVWVFAYNNRRQLIRETLTVNGDSYTIDRHYNGNGDLTKIDYPKATGSVELDPNALGEPTRVGSYVTGVTRHPNAMAAAYTYGNGVAHSLDLNLRGLPQRMRDVGVVNDVYSYDANANVLSIVDQQEGGATTRNMSYDALNRLKTASGIWGGGLYTYDLLDNIRTSTVGSRAATHIYDTRNRLSSVSGTGVNIAYGYDGNGNITSRGAQTFGFDLGNRLRQAAGVASYHYDAAGRRALVVNADGSALVQVYSQAGQLMFASASSTTTSAATVTNYTCPNGAALNTQTQTCTTTSTYAPTAQYGCDAGWSLSGTSCTQTTTSSTAATLTYVCPDGWSLSGSTCSRTVDTAPTAQYSCPSGFSPATGSSTCSKTVAATPVYGCPNGGTLQGSSCVTASSYSATASLSCNGHGSLSAYAASSTGYVCWSQGFPFSAWADPEGECINRESEYGLQIEEMKRVGSALSCKLGPVRIYTCSNGGSLSGTQCSTSSSTSATVTSYTCPSGGAVSGSQCVSTQSAAVNYTCSSGTLTGQVCRTVSQQSASASYGCASGTLSGQSCVSSSTSTVGASVTGYTCPNGGALSGGQCTTTNSFAATPVYGCTNGSAPSNGQCTGAGTTSRTRYIYLDGKLIAEHDSALGVIYAHTDALGSPVARTTPVGGVLARTRFEPYGQVAAGFNPNGANRVGFTGHVNDVATGLTYMQQRYYDPIAGRFLSVDPLVTDASTGKGFGLYVYVENNPYRYVDPDGMQEKKNESRDERRCRDMGSNCQWIVPPSNSKSAERRIASTYNPNDVRGGFNSFNESLVYHPQHYDPERFSELLFDAVIVAAGAFPGLEISAAASSARVLAKNDMFKVRAAPELKEILGWGNGLPGIKTARSALDASSLARIQSQISRPEIESIKRLYSAAAAQGRGGAVAHERLAYMEDILSMWK